MSLAEFPDASLRKLAEILCEGLTHRQLTAVFTECNLIEQGGGPRWERIHLALSARQKADRCGNNVGAFIEAMMAPVRFVRRLKDFSELRHRLNEVLAFSSLHIGENGKLRSVASATTLDEAQQRAGRLRIELVRRQVHAEVLRFCRPEFLQENFFHAVLEATKSVAEKIRTRTGLSMDGAELVERAFGMAEPLLALNTLRNESEKSEQKGFANLVKGIFGTFRNVTAHAPKISWAISEQDALDILSLLSYVHRRLDGAVRTPWTP